MTIAVLVRMNPLLFASIHMAIGGLLGAMIVTEASWFAWPWFVLWLGLFVGGGFSVNYVFGTRYAPLRMKPRVAVLGAGPLLLILISVASKWRELQSASLIEGIVTMVVVIVSANILLFPSWLGFVLPLFRRRNQQGGC